MSHKNPVSDLSRPSLYYTPVNIPSPCRSIDVGDRNVFLGSCFAENVGRRFVESGLQAVCNPLGTIYNPLAIAAVCNVNCAAVSAVQNAEGRWHTWFTGTAFTFDTAEDAEVAVRKAQLQLHADLAGCDNLFLTLGTSRGYLLKNNSLWGDVVVNCHKHPACEFEEVDWDAGQITEELDAVLSDLREQNSRLQVILSVSPYRYRKYGFHESQLSKARLLLAVDQLCRLHPDWICYFPAYEIVLDELRDYRFYADDMLHPSPLAVSHIWQRFHDEWFTPACRTYLQQAAPLLRILQHRPTDPASPAWLALKAETEAKLAALR